MSRGLDVDTSHVRDAGLDDLGAIRTIYNEGIEDRVATLDEELKTEAEITQWYRDRRGGRYSVIVAERAGRVIGWASLNPYSGRCAYRGVADLSMYVARDARGMGTGTALLRSLEGRAAGNAFHKLVLFALEFNRAALSLYRKAGYREVGVFKEQGRLDGRFVDVVAMEKILPSEGDGADVEGAVGGEPACWLHLVCSDCGAVVDRDGAHRAGCEDDGRARGGTSSP